MLGVFHLAAQLKAFSLAPPLNTKTTTHLLLATTPNRTSLLLTPCEVILPGFMPDPAHSPGKLIFLVRCPSSLELWKGAPKPPPICAPTYCLSVGAVGPEGDGHGVEHAHLASHLLHPPHRALLVSVCELDHQTGRGSLQPGRHVRPTSPSAGPQLLAPLAWATCLLCEAF